MSVQELQQLLTDDASAEGVQFVDVREPGECQVAKLPRFKLWPLSQSARCGGGGGGGGNGGGWNGAQPGRGASLLAVWRWGPVWLCRRAACRLPPAAALWLRHRGGRKKGFGVWGQLLSWVDTIAEDLDIAKPTVVLCHHGVRWGRAEARSWQVWATGEGAPGPLAAGMLSDGPALTVPPPPPHRSL